MSEPLKSSLQIGRGSGNPAGFTDFRPMNPWGREMPKLTRPMPHEREGRPPNMKLYQIWVRTPKGRFIAATPKAPKELLEEAFRVLQFNIATVPDYGWRDAQLLPAESTLVV